VKQRQGMGNVPFSPLIEKRRKAKKETKGYFLFMMKRPIYSKLFFILLICSILIAVFYKEDLTLAAAKKIPRIDTVGDSIYLDGEKWICAYGSKQSKQDVQSEQKAS